MATGGNRLEKSYSNLLLSTNSEGMRFLPNPITVTLFQLRTPSFQITITLSKKNNIGPDFKCILQPIDKPLDIIHLQSQPINEKSIIGGSVMVIIPQEIPRVGCLCARATVIVHTQSLCTEFSTHSLLLRIVSKSHDRNIRRTKFVEYSIHFRLAYACFSGTTLLITVLACISQIQGVVVGTFGRSKHFRTALGLKQPRQAPSWRARCSAGFSLVPEPAIQF